jgi:hypothetical protein
MKGQRTIKKHKTRQAKLDQLYPVLNVDFKSKSHIFIKKSVKN